MVFNRAQTAYQVLVASQPEFLNEKAADLWNSEKVTSSQSAHVKIQGEEVTSYAEVLVESENMGRKRKGIGMVSCQYL